MACNSKNSGNGSKRHGCGGQERFHDFLLEIAAAAAQEVLDAAKRSELEIRCDQSLASPQELVVATSGSC